jgi:hypothetical protein
MSLIDSGWAAWLPFELLEAYDALGGGGAARRALERRLEQVPDEASLERWERFRLVAPSRLDVPATPEGLTTAGAYELLEGLGLVAGQPPRPAAPESVELVLTLDHDDVRELERIRGARSLDEPVTPLEALPSLSTRFGGGEVGRNDPCPCGSGKKFKRCHGR